MAYQPVAVIEARIWNMTVGAIVFDDASNFFAFEYDPEFLSQKLEIAPRQMPAGSGVWTFPTLPVETYRRLPAVFADSLPDDFGNALVNAELARQGVRASEITSLDRLAYLGSRGIGALEYRPARGDLTRTATAVEISELVVAARSALRGQIDRDTDAYTALSHLIQVGTSAGGARAKAVIAWNPTTNAVRSGQVSAPAGFEQWLIKLDIDQPTRLGRSHGFGRIEYAYHLMARAAGVAMSDCRLLEEGGRAHFMTRRYDRVAGEKVHIQTLCAMDHLDYRQAGTHSYAQYLQVIDQLCLGDGALEEGFRRMVFNLFAANLDDHTKNLSFMMTRDGIWGLAPAYDVTHSYNPQGEWANRHQMSVNGRFADITMQDIAEVADRFVVPGWRDIVAQVREAVARWPDFARSAGMSPNEAQVVSEDIEALGPRDALGRGRLRGRSSGITTTVETEHPFRW